MSLINLLSRSFNPVNLVYVCMVEEYASKGDLLQLIKSRKRIDETEGRLLFRQLVEGLRVSLAIVVLKHECSYQGHPSLLLDKTNLTISVSGRREDCASRSEM